MNRSWKHLIARSFVVALLSLISAIEFNAAVVQKVMHDYKGVKLGMKPEEVKAALGEPQTKSETSEEFKIGGDDTLTVQYDNGMVKTIMLYFTEAKNVPAWTEVVGKAEVKEQPNGAKVARVEVAEEKFWISMYQNKSGTMTTITISRM